MTLQEAILKVRNENPGTVADWWEALNIVIQTAEAVEKMRGKLPGKLKEPYSEDDEDGYERTRCRGYNEALEDCAAAYVANLPTVEDILEVTHHVISDRDAQLIHDLFVGKVREK